MTPSRDDALARLARHRLSRRATMHGLGVAAATGFGFPVRARAFDGTPVSDGAPATPAPPDWAEIEAQSSAIAPDASFLAAEIVGGACQPVHAFHADAPLASGSSFKLFILGELASQVAAGQIAWEQPMAIEERYKAPPGGDLRFVPAGTTFTVRYLAERMIQKSDNTATDHLLFHLGRENVERRMGLMGVADPARNIPLLSVREFALLKFVYPKDRLDAYEAASVEERRRILATEIDPLPLSALDAVPDQTAPEEIDRVEYFFSREDLCHAMVALDDMARQPGLLPVTEILSLETQVPFDAEVWPYVGFKGGSELGVLAGTWLLGRADGRRFVFAVAFNDATAALDMNAIVAVIAAGRDRLAMTP